MNRTRERVRVLIADDHPIYRDGIVRAIKEWPELELVGEAQNGREALAEIRRLEPEVALLDLRMPGLEGHEVLQAIERDGLPTRVVFLSAHVDGAVAYRIVAAGASGYISKEADRKQICEALVTVARGGTVFAPAVQMGLATEIRERERHERGPALSEREQEVLRLIAEGLSAPDIGKRIHLSPATVKSHLQTLYEKLGVSERAAAVAEAMRRGLLD